MPVITKPGNIFWKINKWITPLSSPKTPNKQKPKPQTTTYLRTTQAVSMLVFYQHLSLATLCNLKLRPFFPRTPQRNRRNGAVWDLVSLKICLLCYLWVLIGVSPFNWKDAAFSKAPPVPVHNFINVFLLVPKFPFHCGSALGTLVII